MPPDMSNVLSDDKKQQVLALGRLGWSLRRIEEATGVRRETASAYLKAAGIAGARPGGRPAAWPPKPAIRGGGVHRLRARQSGAAKPATDTGEVSTDLARRREPSGARAAPRPRARASRTASSSRRRSARGRNAMAIWQDLVDDHGFRPRYASVKRFVLKLRGSPPPEARVVITTAPARKPRSTTATGRWSATRPRASTGGRGSSC